MMRHLTVIQEVAGSIVGSGTVFLRILVMKKRSNGIHRHLNHATCNKKGKNQHILYLFLCPPCFYEAPIITCFDMFSSCISSGIPGFRCILHVPTYTANVTDVSSDIQSPSSGIGITGLQGATSDALHHFYSFVSLSVCLRCFVKNSIVEKDFRLDFPTELHTVCIFGVPNLISVLVVSFVLGAM